MADPGKGPQDSAKAKTDALALAEQAEAEAAEAEALAAAARARARAIKLRREAQAQADDDAEAATADADEAEDSADETSEAPEAIDTVETAEASAPTETATMSAGIMAMHRVISRLAKGLILIWKAPSMTVCPAMVDTIPAEIPEKRKATANMVAASWLIPVWKRLCKLYRSVKSSS